jgi:nitrous oxidase accessory protein
MWRTRRLLRWLALWACAVAVLPARSATVAVPAGADLRAAIAAAAPGDVLDLQSGDYPGPVVIDKPLTLQGPADHSARIVGARQGRTLWVRAADVTLRRLTVTRSGLSLPDMDAGVFLDKSAERARVLDNRVEDNLVGVYVWGARDALVQGNTILGNTRLRVNERGNGVSLWNAPGTRIIGNDISGGRDGIFSNASRDNVFRGNRFTQVRYAVHYMYTDSSEVSDNVSIGNEIAYALMFSRHLTVRGNVGLDSSDQGMNLNATQNSTIEGNVIRGGGRCAFFYNSNFNRVAGNILRDCEVGIHYTAGSDGNVITGNAFIGNRTQVKYVGTRVLDWSAHGRGNYWSDNSAFDLDGDGIADTAYRPNDIIDQVVWRAPAARLLLTSPAVTLVRWAQKQFPALLPGGVIDSAPLMKAPDRAGVLTGEVRP